MGLEILEKEFFRILKNNLASEVEISFPSKNKPPENGTWIKPCLLNLLPNSSNNSNEEIFSFSTQIGIYSTENIYKTSEVAQSLKTLLDFKNISAENYRIQFFQSKLENLPTDFKGILEKILSFKVFFYRWFIK